MLEQLSIFDAVPEVNMEVHDKVKLVLLEEAINSELHNYRKYYFRHLINRIGEIQSLVFNQEGTANYIVVIAGEQIICEEKELQWVAKKKLRQQP